MATIIGRRRFLKSSSLLAVSFKPIWEQLQTPHVSQTIGVCPTFCNRHIEYRILGDTTLPPVVYICGCPTTFYELDMNHCSLQLDRYCWIGINRPGTGRSTFDPGMTFESFARDMGQVFAHLNMKCGWEQFHVLGYSAGGPFALACAELTQWVSKVALVAPAPSHGTAFSQNALTRATTQALNSPVLAKQVNRLFFRSVCRRGITDRMLDFALRKKAFAPVDVEMIRRCSQLRANMARGVAYVPACGVNGIIHEYRLLACPWSIDFNSVSIPIDIWHGHLDYNSPSQNSIELQNQLPTSVAHFFDDEGHLTIWVRRFPEILSRLHNAD